MGLIGNLKDGAKNAGKSKIKKFILKRLRGFGRPFLFIGIIAVILLLFILGVFDLGIEIASGENNPELIYEILDVEDIAELVEIKEDGNGGYYLDFVDDIDDKLQEIVDKANKGDYHNLPTDIDFLKKMLKAEVYTQFPDLGGTVPIGSDGFQGAVKIRRVTPNKNVGEMKNTGRGETSNLEQGTVNEPVSVEDRNDQNKIDGWQSGQKLRIVATETFLYEDQYGIGYWQPIMVEGSTTQEVKLIRNDVVTYQGEYKIDNNALTGQQTIYLKVKTDDDLEGYVKTSTVIAVVNENTQGDVTTTEEDSRTKIATTSRVADSREEIGVEGEEYVVAIAAGRNSSDDLGVVNEEKGLAEEALTIQVAERVEELLNGYSNIRVVQTGSTSDNPDGVKPEDRAEKTRDANPDLCIQIYFGDGNEVGVQTIFKEGDQVSQQLADILAENISSAMGLDNLSSVSDTVKCVDSEGNTSSLNIIDNSVVAGFPSVVALGGNLSKDPDASIIAEDGVEKYAQGIVNGIDEYFKADHTGLTAEEIEDMTFTDSVDSKIMNMQYVSQEKMQEYIDSGNVEAVLQYYTLDDDRNVVVATWSQKEDGSIELKTNNSMNLKTTLQKYVMPFEYLLYFYMDTDETHFVDDLADEVMNSEIIIAVQDEVTTTHTIETTEQSTDATLDRFDVDWHTTNSREFTTETVNTKVNLTYVSTWCVKTYQENSYSDAILNLLGDEIRTLEIPGKVTESSSTTMGGDTVILDNAQGNYHHPKVDDNGDVVLDEEGNTVYVDETYYYDILEHIITNTHTISNTYEKGEYVTEGRENVFTELYVLHDMISKVRTSDYLFTIIENNERTANLLDLTKYLIYKATNVLYGVGEFDFSIYDLSAFEDMGSSMGGLETFKEYLHSWEGNTGLSEDGTKYRVGDDGAGHPTVGYGIDIYNSGFLDRFLAAGYDVSIGSYIDVEFVDALEDEEIQSAIQTVESKCAGLNLTTYQKYALVSRIYNCGSGGAFTSRNGKTFVEAYNAYWNAETDDEYGVTSNDSMYSHPLYTTYMSEPVTSNGNYMLGLERRRKSEWILFKTGYYDSIGKWCSQSGTGNIVEKAVECHRYLRTNGYYYAQAGVNIPITGSGRTIDCSSFVSWVLYEAGFEEMEGYQQTSYTFLANKWGWQELSVSDAQPGDLLVYSAHVEIVAGDAGDRFLVYNCGSNNSINAEGTSELPESSTSGYTKGQVLKVLRPS